MSGGDSAAELAAPREDGGRRGGSWMRQQKVEGEE